MKLKIRIAFVGTLIFMIIISYKILVPETFQKSESDFKEWPDISEDEKFEKDKIIQELIRKYKLNYDYVLTESPWKIAASWVSERQIHPEYTPELGAILKALAERPITIADVGYKGTQLKMALQLHGKQTVAFKPKWYSRDYVITDSPVSGADRHNGEIAAFHLGRILEFRRTPLVAGRRVNMKTEIKPVATQKLADTFYEKDSNTCFYGKCYYCKGPETGVCGEGDILEGTVVLWMPKKFKLKLHKHPWSRTYREGKLAQPQ